MIETVRGAGYRLTQQPQTAVGLRRTRAAMGWLLPAPARRPAGGARSAALVGMLLGGDRHAPCVGALVGGVRRLCVAVVVCRRAARAPRCMRWLRGAQDRPAPRDAGFWGELGYRVERALRARERRPTQERPRLAQFLSAIEASPNGVLLLDADDQIEWCNSRAADHFGLDPQRDRRQRVTNLVRAPAFVGLPAGAATSTSRSASRPARPRHAVGADPAATATA